MSITENLQELLEKAVRLAEGQPIRKIKATLGELTGHSPEQVQAEFVQQRRLHPATVAAEARLELVPEPGRALCLTCGVESGATPIDATCPLCGSQRRRVIAGQHLSFLGMSLIGAEANHPRKRAAPLEAISRGQPSRRTGSRTDARMKDKPKPARKRAAGSRAAVKAPPN